MLNKRVTGVFFSPTGRTQRVVQQLAAFFDADAHLHDLTSFERGALEQTFTAQDLVIVGAPVYGGRIPDLAAKRLQGLNGQQTPAIAVVTYGNRAYEDALLELKTILEENQFVVVGAAALVTEHSIVPSVATGRPEEADWRQLEQFAAQLQQALGQAQPLAVTVPGNRPYRNYDGIPLKPKANHKCVNCGYCARECPAGAIPASQPRKTDTKACISCMRCVTYCPQGARSVNKLLLEGVRKKMEKSCSQRRENEFYV